MSESGTRAFSSRAIGSTSRQCVLSVFVHGLFIFWKLLLFNMLSMIHGSLKHFFFKCCVWCHTGGVLINKFTLITTKYFILPRTGLTSVHWHMLPKELLSFRELKYRQIVGIGFCYITHRPTSIHRIYLLPSKHTHSLELHAVHPILVKYNILSSNSPSARFYYFIFFLH